MNELPFASFANRFSGQVGWVVGRGPTEFRYQDLGRENGPFFFINDAVGQEPWLPAGRPSFFFAHDEAMEGWLLGESLRSIPVLITDQPLTGPSEHRRRGLIGSAADPRLEKLRAVILYRKNGPLDRSTLLERNREEIASSAQLHTANGTIHPLLHFAWYVGCSKLCLVGCDGLPEIGYDDRLENRSGTIQQNALPIRIEQDLILDRLSLPRDYLGAVPHRLKMLVELRADPASHERLVPVAEQLTELFRQAGCSELSARDLLTGTDCYWIKGVWPGVEAWIRCLTSAPYRQLVEGPVKAVVGDLTEGLRIGHKAIRPSC